MPPFHPACLTQWQGVSGDDEPFRGSRIFTAAHARNKVQLPLIDVKTVIYKRIAYVGAQNIGDQHVPLATVSERHIGVEPAFEVGGCDAGGTTRSEGKVANSASSSSL